MKLFLVLLFILPVLLIITSCNKETSTEIGDNGPLLIKQWEKTNGTENLTVSCLAKQKNYLFAGTSSWGVYWSTDGGTNWMPRRSGLTDSIVSAIVSSGDVLFVGTRENGVFRSTNDGLTWEPANNGMGVHRILSLVAFDNYVLAGTYNASIYRSTNQGLDWQWASNEVYSSYIRSITKSDSGIFIGTDYGGIYHSKDYGITWKPSPIPNARGSVAALLVKGSTILASTDVFANVYSSSDLGKNWTDADSGMTAPGVYSFSANENMIFAGTFWGFYYSTDDGLSWKEASQGLVDKTIYATLISNSYIFIGGSGKGVMRRSLSQISTN